MRVRERRGTDRDRVGLTDRQTEREREKGEQQTNRETDTKGDRHPIGSESRSALFVMNK